MQEKSGGRFSLQRLPALFSHQFMRNHTSIRIAGRSCALAFAAMALISFSGCAPKEFNEAETSASATATDKAAQADTATTATTTADDTSTGILQFPAVAAPADYKLPWPDALPATDMKETGKRGGSITISTIGGPKTFDPITANESSSSQIINAMFSTFLGYDYDKQQYFPLLLKSLTVGEDNKTWTATLRDGLKWSDGQPITADDVMFTAQVIYDPNIINPSADTMKVADKPLVFEKIDNLSVKITAAEPTGFMPVIIGGFTPLPRHTLEAAYKAGTFNTALSISMDPAKLVVSGPFKLQVYQVDERVVLVRNDEYFRVDKNGVRLPYLDNMVFSINPDTDAMTAKFRSGQADELNAPRPEMVADLRAAQEKENFTLYDKGPGNSTSFFWFNQKAGNKPDGQPYVRPELSKVFNDVRFRRAVSHSINRDGMIRSVLRGLAVKADSLTPQSLKEWHAPNLPMFDYDVEKAKALLDEAGYKDTNGDGVREMENGQPIAFTFITNVENKTRVELSTIIATDLRAVGIQATPQSVDFNTLVTQLNDSFQYEACLLGFTGSIHPITSMNMWRSSGRTHAWNSLQKTPATPWEAEIDKLTNEFSRALDLKSQQKAVFEMQRIFAENVPMVPLYTMKEYMAVRNKFGNVRPTPFGENYWNAEEQYVK